MKIFAVFIAFGALTTCIEHIYGANLNGDEPGQHEHLRGMLAMGKGKKCTQDSDCKKYDKYGQCGKCISAKCKKVPCPGPNPDPNPVDDSIACGDRCHSDSDCEDTNGCSYCKPFGTYGECHPRCQKGNQIITKTGLVSKQGYHDGTVIVGGPCLKGYTRSGASINEIFPMWMSCGAFNSIGPLTSTWASDNKSDCRLKIEYDVHKELLVSCQYLIRETCTNP